MAAVESSHCEGDLESLEFVVGRGSCDRNPVHAAVVSDFNRRARVPNAVPVVPEGDIEDGFRTGVLRCPRLATVLGPEDEPICPGGVSCFFSDKMYTE